MLWLWIGDSITDGMESHLSSIYSARGDRIVIEAHVGWTSRKWLEEGDLAALIERVNPDAVVFALGTNDMTAFGQMDLASVSKLAEIATSRRVFWIGPFNSSEAGAGLDTFFGHGVAAPIVLNGADTALGLPRTRDGVHFGGAESNILAGRLVAALDNAMPASPWIKVGITACVVAVLWVVFWRLARRGPP